MTKEINLFEMQKLIYQIVKNSIDNLQSGSLGSFMMMLDYMPKEISEVFIQELAEKLNFDYFESIEIKGGRHDEL